MLNLIFTYINTTKLCTHLHIQALFAECNYAECHYAKCHYLECHYAECHYAECRYADCRYAECHGTKLPFAEVKGNDGTFSNIMNQTSKKILK